MESNQVGTDNFEETVNRNEILIFAENIKYLYPNLHCMNN